MQAGPKKVFEPDPNPKNSPEEPKKCKKAPKFGRMKNKKIGLYFQNKNWQSVLVGSKNVFEPELDPKNSPNGPKK